MFRLRVLRKSKKLAEEKARYVHYCASSGMIVKNLPLSKLAMRFDVSKTSWLCLLPLSAIIIPVIQAIILSHLLRAQLH